MQLTKNENIQHVMVTGGGGYVGAILVPKLLDLGYKVTVLDLFIYGEDVFDSVQGQQGLSIVKGDIRDVDAVKKSLQGVDTVIHLACISNDPSFDLNPELGRSINLDCFRPLVQQSKKAGVRRFIYASSSSVYGIKEGVDVTEEQSLDPLTDYSKFKVDCEVILEEEREPGFVCTTVRPATVCGYSPRQRLDVVVNILTNLAYNKGAISVFGGSQLRPNIHIQDMCAVYLLLLSLPDDQIDGGVYNAGYENHSVMQLAETVRSQVGEHVTINQQDSDDLRSYHVSSEKIKNELGFEPQHTIADAVRDLVEKMDAGVLKNTLEDSRYFNIKRMQELNLK